MNDLDALFTRIAQKHLRIETLEIRNSDGLDFYDVSVWGVLDALQAAYDAGRMQRRQARAKRASATTK